MYPSLAEAKKQYAAMQKALEAAEQEIERKRRKVSELAEAMNTLKGQKLAEERKSENSKKACSKNGKRICKTFGKIRVCFRRNISPCDPAGAEQIKTGAGRERDMSTQ